MKKLRLIFFIGLVVLFGVIGMLLSRNIIDKETQLARKLKFENDNQLLALFFLGGLEDSYDYSNIYKYYSEQEISQFETISTGGEECYLIIPRYNMNLTISSLRMAEDGGTVGKKIIDTNKPIFLQCNMSDIFPNSEISFEYNEIKYTYSPYISLKDGSVVVEDFVHLINE